MPFNSANRSGWALGAATGRSLSQSPDLAFPAGLRLPDAAIMSITTNRQTTPTTIQMSVVLLLPSGSTSRRGPVWTVAAGWPGRAAATGRGATVGGGRDKFDTGRGKADPTLDLGRLGPGVATGLSFLRTIFNGDNLHSICLSSRTFGS